MDKLFPMTKPSAETASLSYVDNGDYLQEQLQWLDACISFQLHLQQLGEIDNKELFTDDADVLDSYQLHIKSRMVASENEGVFLYLPYLSHMFQLSDLETKAIMVCLAIELERKYESAYEYLQVENGMRLPTPDLIARLISRSEEERNQVIYALRANGLLRTFFMRRDLAYKQGSLLGLPLQLDERIVQFLKGNSDLPVQIKEFANLLDGDEEPPPLIGNEEVQRKLRQWLTQRVNQADSRNKSLIISLYGKKGNGKQTQVAHVGHYFRERVLFVDCAKLLRRGHNMKTMLPQIYREAMIQQAILVLIHFRDAMEEADQLPHVPDLLDEMAEWNHLVFLLSEKPCLQTDWSRQISLEIELAILSDQERTIAWQQLASSYEVDPEVDWEALSARFLFTPGQIVYSLQLANELAQWESNGEDETKITWHHLIKACYKQLHHQLGVKATRLSPKHRWHDLILPEPQKQKIMHACNHIKYKHTVYERWGFYCKLSYGTGISLLFSGPPGTGKTMAAEIVANELAMEIYRVDISQIISKYIGETEKNLREIFAEAESSYAVLFFDEADAIFGKRSEVKDAHDKYANTEVSFLLQKMEEYRGISIMATNYLQNIDEAFLRRINYIIRFPFPDEKQREMIWQHIFPPETPLESNIDYRFLAKKLQVAGGGIKNIALTAAFLASGNQEAVGMKHILKAYQYELDKSYRSVDRSELAEYAFYLDDI